jgi:type I restriction enzyme S subunit
MMTELAGANLQRFKPYPAYKDSGVEWLGEIPAHWEVNRLKFVLKAPLKYGANEAAEFDDPDLPRYVRITDISENDGLRDETFKSLPADVAEEYLLREGDLLFARSGATAGKTFLYRKAWGVCAYAGYLIRARLDAGRCHPQFVRYFTASSGYWDWLASSFIQATIQNVSAERYASLSVPLALLPEQRVIAAFLDRETARIDALVAKKERLIELLQEKRTALITRAVTKGLDPNVPMKDSGIEWLGEIPAHWEVKPLKQAVSFAEGPGILAVDFVDEGVPLLRISGIGGRTASLAGCNFLSPKLVGRRWAHFRVQISDLLISGSASRGLCSEVDDVTVGAIPYTGIIIVRPRMESSVKNFVRWFFLSEEFLTQAELASTGSTIQHFGPTHLSTMALALPPLPEQGAVADYLDRETAKMAALVSKVRAAIDRLKELRTALISAAVTGKIDVREG